LLAPLAGIVTIVVLAVACGGGSGSKAVPTATPGELTSGGLKTPEAAQPTPEATIDLNRQEATNPDLNPTAVSENDRFIIAKYGVNAPLSLKTVNLDGAMPDPNGPDDVALYNFSPFGPGLGGTPGKGGNVVMAGHVDSGLRPCKNGTVQPPCQAVLWDLSEMRVGDEVEIRYGGQSIKYRVTANPSIKTGEADWTKIVTSTAEESLTVITCGGDFNRVTREYGSRQVLTAVRIV
jgi:LPXTG-site transpeptidase (sortase) family protein